ncbi:hypothetical protein PG984_011544 [Apiospora sp. TS-2023a]
MTSGSKTFEFSLWELMATKRLRRPLYLGTLLHRSGVQSSLPRSIATGSPENTSICVTAWDEINAFGTGSPTTNGTPQ